MASIGRAVEEETTPVNPYLIDPAMEEQDTMEYPFEDHQYTQGVFEQNEMASGFEGTQGLAWTEQQWDNTTNQSSPDSQFPGYNKQPVDGGEQFNQWVDDIVSQPFNADPLPPMASQQQWDGQHGGLSSANYSQGNSQNHRSQVYDDNVRQPLQLHHGFDDRQAYGSYPGSEYNSQQILSPPQYPIVNDQGHFGGHNREDSGYGVQEQQYVPQMTPGHRNEYPEPHFGAQHVFHSQQAMAMEAIGMHQQFQQPPRNQYQQPRAIEHRRASPLVAPQPQRPLPGFVEAHTESSMMGYGGRPQTSTSNFSSFQASPIQDERQRQAKVPQRYENHRQQAMMPSLQNFAPQTYQESLQQPLQGPVNTGRSSPSNGRPSRESTVESQSVPVQVTIPPDCPVGNLTDYSLDFVPPPKKLIKKAVDEHWFDYPGSVAELFTSPFPEYNLTPEDPNVFLPAVIHVKSLSPAQMLEWHARAPQHRDLMHQFIVPRMTGYPNELPGDTPAIKQKKFKNNTISMRQQRLREHNGQFMGDAKISRVAKTESVKSLTKVFKEILPKINGARLLHVSCSWHQIRKKMLMFDRTPLVRF